MKEFVEKLIERLKKGSFAARSADSECNYHSFINLERAIGIVNQLAEEYNPSKTKSLDNGWIPCIERLPEEPDIQYQALEYFPEYNVTMDGAEKSTTLHYLGDGEWSDAEGNSYNIIAWKQLPKAYCLEESKNSNRTFSGKV